MSGLAMTNTFDVVTSARQELGDFRTRMIGVINGEEEELFSYYSDELYFSVEEVIGKTAEQCRDLFHKKDIRYLQS